MRMGADAVTMLSWEALGIVWLIGLAFTKRTVKAQPDRDPCLPNGRDSIVASVFWVWATNWFRGMAGDALCL